MIDPHSRTPYNTKNFRLMKYKMDVKYWPRVWEQYRTMTACHTLYATWKTRLKMISSHAIGILIPIGEIELPLLGFCRLLFSFPYIVFDSRIICKMITCNYFDSWKKDYNTHAIITRKFYVPGFHYPADFICR